MSKFKVGDIVRGNNNNYVYTNSDMLKGRVVEVHDCTNAIDVEALKFRKGSNGYNYFCEGTVFSNLQENDFELVNDNDNDSITISIDPNDPEGAQKILSDAIKKYKKEKRGWTEEEIDKAEKIADEITIELAHQFVFPVFYLKSQSSSSIRLEYGVVELENLEKKYGFDHWKRKSSYETKLHKDDVYNPTIARCVLLCKAVGRPIPKFILEK